MEAVIDAPRSSAQQALGGLAPLAAWAVYAPIAVKYTALLLLTAASMAVIASRPQGWRSLLRSAEFVLPAALLTWLAVTTLWTPAAWRLVLSHAWSYTLPLGAVIIAAACAPQAARRALAHFVGASALVGALWALHAFNLLPASRLWDSTVTAVGNQRIAASVLMALAVVFAAWFAGRRGTPASTRAAYALAAALALAGLLSQDRRTGMVLLPLLLVAWACAAPRALWQRLVLATAVAACAAGVWVGSDNVRARFAEGSRELAAYRDDAEVKTSWGQRVRMLQLTTDIVREAPLAGHGVGSWVPLWQARTPPGTMLWENTTPHNEYLLVATQGGVAAALLLAAWFGVMMARALRAGSLGLPAMLLWLTVAVTALANATVRDTKLAIPLLLLAGLGGALQRGARTR